MSHVNEFASVAIDVEQVAPPGNAVAVYAVMGEPPFDDGAIQETVAFPLPATVETFVGGPGTAADVTVGESELAVEKPAMFSAFTENVYAVPAVSPLMVHVYGDGSTAMCVAHVLPSGDAVTV
jgi:hypothetical protein